MLQCWQLPDPEDIQAAPNCTVHHHDHFPELCTQHPMLLSYPESTIASSVQFISCNIRQCGAALPELRIYRRNSKYRLHVSADMCA